MKAFLYSLPLLLPLTLSTSCGSKQNEVIGKPTEAQEDEMRSARGYLEDEEAEEERQAAYGD